MLALEFSYMSRPPNADSGAIAECLAGDTQAFGALVSRHRDGIYTFIRHTVSHDTDAQDLAQETFVRAFTGLKRFRHGAPFEPWIYTIAANLCRRHLRRSRRAHEAEDPLADTEELEAPAHTDPAVAIGRRDERLRLRKAVQALPDEQRMVVVLRHYRDCSYQDIAEILKIPVSTVEHRLRAARKVLKQALSSVDPDCPADSPKRGGH